MSDSLWRVGWNLHGTAGPLQIVEFGKEEKAMEWAEGLLKAGAEDVLVTELIVGKKIRLGDNNTSGNLFHK